MNLLLVEIMNSLLVLLVVLILTVESRADYHKTWSVHVKDGIDPNTLAKEFNMLNLGLIGQIDNHYLFEHNSHPRRSRRHAQDITTIVQSHDFVIEAVQQQILSRKKRSITIRNLEFKDPHFKKQWYLKGTYNNVTNAWKHKVTGKGVVVTILDDGLERTHPDLKDNFSWKASYDFNNRDADPMPRPTITNENKHGTRCAGEVSAAANDICGVGAAYHAMIGGIRMLDGDVTDSVEAGSLAYNSQFIDIYSSSWGPDDDGRTVDGPGRLAKLALSLGTKKGRKGFGSIFVWASGNGGSKGDNCNCDGYSSSIYTISIGSASERGEKPWYAEECSSTIAVTYSSGSRGEQKIHTTDLDKKCTAEHTGTSASAPLAAGIFALVLEANPELTWRDLQHLIVNTSHAGNLKDPAWSLNGVGRNVSHKFGYGVIDAGALVTLAQRWNNFPEQKICETESQVVNRHIRAGEEVKTEFEIETSGCHEENDHNTRLVNYLEHVQAIVTITAGARGDISLTLLSPKGTLSHLLTQRTRDRTRHGFDSWEFLTLHMWGEDPYGKWILAVKNNGDKHMQLTNWKLRLHGTTTGQSQKPYH